jgi:phosphatidylglycerol:prolipoprotein diacylglycerol transferase
MHPELITLPGGFNIKTYGFFLMVGFLSAVWMAMRRAARVGVDPDRLLDLSFVALILGVAGARAFYVIHYWETQFADRSNKLLAIVDIRQGGLEFLGGLMGGLLAVVLYLRYHRQSIRLFLDVIAPSVMWGLAFGRIGCFFNGCCFGAPCIGPEQEAKYAWAMRFPFGSPPQLHQWEHRQVTLPAELVVTNSHELQPWPVPEAQVNAPIERLERSKRAFLDAKEAYDLLKATEPDSWHVKRLEERVTAARTVWEESEKEFAALRSAQQLPSRTAPDRRTLPSELRDLALQYTSLPVHPTQLYAAINAMLLSGLLSVVFSRRRRHGVVIGLMFLLYPVARVFEEMIRADNPHDVAGLTISQFISLVLFAVGAVFLWLLHTRLPERSPYAEAAAPPPSEEPTTVA